MKRHGTVHGARPAVYLVALALAISAACDIPRNELFDPPGEGFLRLFLQYHATFSVNSVAHTIGGQPYSRATSARDSFLTALITLGEGYHNFHHRFPADYRNGIRFYHFDPTKWWVWTCSRIGVTRDILRTPPDVIARARQTAAAA